MTLNDAISNAGYAPPRDIVWDGKLHRFATDESKRYSKDGWYVAHDDSTGQAAAFGSWRDGASHTWTDGGNRKLTRDELARIEEQKRKAIAEEKKDRDQAAERSRRVYESAVVDVVYSAYLQRKGIDCPEGVRAVHGLSSRALGFDGDEWSMSGLIVPMVDKSGSIRSLQLIPEEESRRKLFARGGQTANCFHALGDIASASRVLIAEGLATAQSCRQATGDAAVVAFSAGNLPAVAGIVRALNARADIVICADDDEAGRAKAQEAANRSAARFVLPPGGVNDFNDAHRSVGLPAIRQALLGPNAENDQEGKDDWKGNLIVKHKDNGDQVIPCRVHNLIEILHHAPEFAKRIRYNQFSDRVSFDGSDIGDVEPVEIKAQLEHRWINEKVATSDVLDALSVVASKSPYHPVRDYLSSVSWDGVERVESFFEDHCGTPRDEYHIAAANALFVSSVARIFKPGCKVDTVTILQSMQGWGKTKLWIALYGEWCVEITSSLSDKDFYAGLRGVWCADFAELDAFSRAETTQIKRIITSQSDTYRPHFGRSAKTFPRQCVFVGGTNRDDWHTDSTGGRRFIPIVVKQQIDEKAIEANRDQLWAEAVVRFNRGQSWWNIPDAEKHQQDAYQGDPWEEPIASYMLGRGSVSVSDLLGSCLRIETGRQSRADQMRVAAILKRRGWERRRTVTGWVYVPKKE